MNGQQHFITYYQRMAKLLTKNYIHRVFTPDCFSILPELKIQPQFKLLDVGCKNGRLLFKLASFLEDCEFHGVDNESQQINRNKAQNRFKNVQFHCSSAENLPFENDYFDIITCANALRHFPQRVRALDEIYRILKHGGELYILEGIREQKWNEKLDKILRQSKFIRPEKKYLPRTALFSKSYFIHYVK